MRNKIRALRIRTGGIPTPGLPFQGEVMTCALCGKQQPSDPAVESGWDRISIDGQAFYVCPEERGYDAATATKEEVAAAYERIMRRLVLLARRAK